jgi:ABC-type lipoprotein release transport system permease subunit
MLVLLAWKNVWRNKKRSFIILTAIALGLWSGLFAAAAMYGMWDSTVNSAIDRDLGHIQIHSKAFEKEKLIENFIPDGNEIESEIKTTPGVKSVSSRTIIEGMASSAATSWGVSINGINPVEEAKVTNINKLLVSGNYFDNDKKNQIVISQKLADKLGIKLNSKMVLSFQALDGNLIYAAFRVTGIFKTESSIFDATNVFVKQNDIYKVMGSEPIVHEITIRTASIQTLNGVLNNLKQKFPNLDVQSWETLAPELSLSFKSIELELNIFLGIILFALLFGITNTMLMSVMDRVRELGVLMAVGMKRLRLFALIIIETILLSISGGIIGIILGTLSIIYFSSKGINLSLFAQGLSSYGIGSMLYPSLPFSTYPTLTLMIIFTAIFSAVYPAIKAIRLNPAEAIRTY